MYFNYKLTTTHMLAAVMMVAAATTYTNLNAAETGTSTIEGSVHDAGAPIPLASTWFSESGSNDNTHTLLKAIADSSAHGLNPETYGISSLEQDLDSYVTKSEQSGSYFSSDNDDQRETLESDLYQAFEQLSTDLGRGVLEAQKTQRSLYRAAPTVDTETHISDLKSGKTTVFDILAELTPSTPKYQKLVDHMRFLLDQRDSGVTRTQVKYAEGVAFGSEHESIIDVRARLQETGDLDEESALSLYFGSDVEEALKAVQNRNGITATGELNEDTVIALNHSIDHDIEEVAMNLERWRWMPRELGERHILINVPAYKLSMMNGEQQIVDMAVVVGSKKHQTPVFSKGAQFVEVAPTWTVPASITNNELIPIELKKPGYLESERMDFFRWTGSKLVKVPRSQVTRADFHKKPFPYVLRQRAGADNALGKLKILMPNKHAIYMHDTQAKKLFAKTDRAYSHGCIRLSDPFRLGSLLLQLDGKSIEETDTLLQKTKTTRVELNEKTPTHITYFTAWIDDDGKLNRRKDVYKHNEPLIKGLHAKKTIVSTLNNRPIAVIAEQEEL